MGNENLIGFKNNPAYRLVVYTVLTTAATFAVKQVVDAGLEDRITITAEEPIVTYGDSGYDAGVQYQAAFLE
ncbi:MAG: hypothetical protein Q8Q01_05705 [archaeon]|nr:hypothetical protein [archaeon]